LQRICHKHCINIFYFTQILTINLKMHIFSRAHCQLIGLENFGFIGVISCMRKNHFKNFKERYLFNHNGFNVAIANKYPDKIVAIYIRNISLKKELMTLDLLSTIQNKGIYTCHSKHTDEAILHAKFIGLIA
jgi:hypothetical protein